MKFHFAQKADPNMASWRYRVQAPTKYLESIGWKHEAKEWWNADIIVLGKHWHPARDYALIREMKRRRITVVFDVCDYHMDGPLGKHYRRMIEACDGLTVPNESWLSVGLPRSALVVGDGYEWEEREPKCEASSPLKILWYGHASNLPALHKVKSPPDSVLEVITGPGEHQFKVWSKETMQAGYDWCDLVIVPAESALKSPNRQIEAIRQGRFVVASDLPQHRPTGTYCGNINEGIEWYRHNLPEALLRLRDAQTAVKHLHSPEVIGRQWEIALTSIHRKRRDKAA